MKRNDKLVPVDGEIPFFIGLEPVLKASTCTLEVDLDGSFRERSFNLCTVRLGCYFELSDFLVDIVCPFE